MNQKKVPPKRTTPVEKERKVVKKIPKKPKKKRKIGKLLLVLFLIALLGTGIYLLLTLPTFRVAQITVEGSNTYPKEKIEEVLSLQTGRNLFIEYFTTKKDNISTLSYIDTVKLSFQLPNILQVKVTERAPVYLAFDKEKNRFFWLDKDGYILEETTIDKKKEEQMLLYGITFDDEVTLGEKINEIDLTKIHTFLSIQSEYEKTKLSGKITKVSFENSLTTITLNDKLNIIFPNATEVKYKMTFLKGIIDNIGEDAVGVIDMTKTNPTFSSF